MPRFIIEDRFWELFPDARIGVALGGYGWRIAERFLEEE